MLSIQTLKSSNILYNKLQLLVKQDTNNNPSNNNDLNEGTNQRKDNLTSTISTICSFNCSSSFFVNILSSFISCNHFNCLKKSHFLCSSLTGLILIDNSYLIYECQDHYNQPLFCICQTNSIDTRESLIEDIGENSIEDTQEMIKCQRCHELYHFHCLKIDSLINFNQNNFYCQFCSNLPDIINIQHINQQKQKKFNEIKQANLLISLIHTFELNVCPIIDKMNLLLPFRFFFPNIFEALLNDITLSYRLYLSEKYKLGIQLLQEINQNNKKNELIELFSNWEEQLLQYKLNTISENILMEWCCSFSLIINEITSNINQKTIQSRVCIKSFQNLLQYLKLHLHYYLSTFLINLIFLRCFHKID